MNKPELLAPAGDIDALKAAVRAGADAIYIGGTKFGARAYAKGIDGDELVAALDYCHLRGRKVYLTVNTLLKEKELNSELIDYLRPAYEAGLDAVIVQDYGVLRKIREHFPDLPIHASTQMCVSSSYGMNLLRQMGVSRVVFPRELSLCELRKAIKVAGTRGDNKIAGTRGDNKMEGDRDYNKTTGTRAGLETEVFIHGALCYCVSGQCLMSSIIGGRSGNRGRCAQVCRLPFPNEHLLNLKDLNTLSILPDIIETGVTSLKIEGRMKSPRYTAGVVSVYRKYIDKYLELRNEGGQDSDESTRIARAKDSYKVASADQHILTELFNRGGYTTGYFETHNSKKMIFKGEKPEMRTPDESVIKKIDENFINKELKIPVSAKVTIIAGRPAKMELAKSRPAKMELAASTDNAQLTNGQERSESSDICKVTVFGDNVAEAENRPLTEEDVRKKISKFGDTNFELKNLEIELLGRVFMPVATIGELRRNAIEKLETQMLSYHRRAGATGDRANITGDRANITDGGDE